MTFTDLVKLRFSSRNYLDKPVEEEKIIEVLETARLAPSAANYQPWRFYIIRSQEILHQIFESYPREWFKKAPIVIVVLGDKNISWKRNFDGKDHLDIDVSIVIDHITLKASEIGLATCWVCNFDPAKLREALKIPVNLEPIALLPLAYPADKADVNRHELKRNRLDSMVKWL